MKNHFSEIQHSAAKAPGPAMQASFSAPTGAVTGSRRSVVNRGQPHADDPALVGIGRADPAARSNFAPKILRMNLRGAPAPYGSFMGIALHALHATVDCRLTALTASSRAVSARDDALSYKLLSPALIAGQRPAASADDPRL